MKLSFYGAAGEVTGSNYLLETDRSSIVIDCGAFQGGKEQELKNVAPFLYEPGRVDALVLTHAHLDHVGRLAKLVASGFRGHIWCTPATKELAELIMLDAAKIMSHEELKFGDEPLYGEDDVFRTLGQVKTLDYDTRIEIAEGIEIRLVDAGHILGSASVELWTEGKKLLFSGDVGNKGAPIIEDPTPVREADIVLCESTYGGRTHEAPAEKEAMLRGAIETSIAQRGVLLIPAFALERTQELLFTLNGLVERQHVKQLPIFVDSPLAIKTTEVFGRFPEYYDDEAQGLIAAGDDFFQMPGLKFTETVEESKAIKNVPAPKIVIAGSGMMTGGRIKFHLREYLDDPNTTVFIVGFQVEGTLGRRLLDGATHVDLFGETVTVRATIIACGGFSAHADHPQLLSWLGAVKQSQDQRIFLTHGDPENAGLLQKDIGAKLGREAVVPRFGQRVSL